MHNPHIARLISLQDGVITRVQALELVTPAQLRRRLDTGEWRRLADGVYFDVSHRMSHEARLRAAVFAAGEDATASGSSAAWWHGLCELAPARPEVTIPKGRKVRRTQQYAIRRRNLDSSDVEVVRGLSVTALPLTVLEAATTRLGGSVLMDQALQTRVSIADLTDAHQRNPRRVGSAAAAKLLRSAASGGRSEAEKRFHAILRNASVDEWTPQYATGGYYLDAAFVDERVGCEIDGWRFHSDPTRNAADMRRQNVLSNAGWLILRFDWHRLMDDPDGVVADVCGALRVRRVGTCGA